MKSFKQKKEELEDLKEKLPKSLITIFTTFSKAGEKGLSVGQMTELRRLLKGLNSKLVVTKKTLIDLALKAAGKDVDVRQMSGSIGLVLGNDDPYAVSKKLYEFSRKNQALHFWGALIDKGFINVEEFLEMAKMPSREALLARLFGMMKYPVTGLCIVLSEITKKQSSAS